ncbi:unnamed protein product [Rhodiola kirilowii]
MSFRVRLPANMRVHKISKLIYTNSGSAIYIGSSFKRHPSTLEMIL